MLRGLEIGLFLLPFLLFIGWRLAGGGVPSVGQVAWALGLLAALATALFRFASYESLAPGQRYVPARIENGRIVPGHGS
jgi:hypothetical protein